MENETADLPHSGEPITSTKKPKKGADYAKYEIQNYINRCEREVKK